MSWKQTNDLNKPFTLGLNAEINVEELITTGKVITSGLEGITTRSEYQDLSLNEVTRPTFAGDVSFNKNIHARGASFQRLGSNSEQALMFVDDVSFGSSIQGNDASFISMGSTDGNILKIIDDVSFSKSIRARDASFHHLGSNSEQALIFSNDVSFGGSIHGNDASFSSIGAMDGNNIIINDDVSFNGAISVEDACFNTIGATNDNLEFLTDVSFNGRIQTSDGDAKFSYIDSLTVNSEDVEFALEISSIPLPKGAYLSGGKIGAQAGMSTALSATGDVVAVGAPYYDYIRYFPDNDLTGRVQVFDYSAASDSWIQKGGDLSGGQDGANAGMSTALSASGDVVAVGVPNYDYGNSGNAGRVQVFDYSAASHSWVQKGGDLSGGQNGAFAGMSTALSANGDVVAVGAPYYDYHTENNDNTGRVQVFDYSAASDSWVQRVDILPVHGGSNTKAGTSTALSASGDVVAVGATSTYNGGEGYVGVYIQKKPESTLSNIIDSIIASSSLFVSNGNLYTFAGHRFTNCGKTGRSGPSRNQIVNAYLSSEINGYVSEFSGHVGAQKWTVPKSGLYRFEMRGANGATATTANSNSKGGRGNIIYFDTHLTFGEHLKIIVGQCGEGSNDFGGGGGASIITRYPYDTSYSIIGCAGGGGGRGKNSQSLGIPGAPLSYSGSGSTNDGKQSLTVISGYPVPNVGLAYDNNNNGAELGGGGADAGQLGDGGAGFFHDGISVGAHIYNSWETAGKLYDSAAGGEGNTYGNNGGFGGGGCGGATIGMGVIIGGAGGGGGYTGGNGGITAGGGGSFVTNAAFNVSDGLDNNVANSQNPVFHGYCVITFLG